jgi:hypothetical protein
MKDSFICFMCTSAIGITIAPFWSDCSRRRMNLRSGGSAFRAMAGGGRYPCAARNCDFSNPRVPSASR